MVDLIDKEPVAALAKRMTARVVHGNARKRMAKLVAEAFLADPASACALNAAELASAPDWVRDKVARGGFVGAFVPSADLRDYLRACIRGVSAAAAELAHLDALPEEALTWDDRRRLLQAERFFAKIDRMSLKDIVVQSGVLASARRRRLKWVRDSRRRFPHHEVYAAPGRVWSRIVSVAELGRVGAELHNCLSSGSSRHQRYASMLRTDTARFWVLRDQRGLARAVIMASSAEQRIAESGGPGNAHISSDDPDLAVLVKALNLSHKLPAPRRRVQIEDIAPHLARLRAQAIAPRPPHGA